MRIKLPGAEVITLTGQTVDKLIRNGDADAALLYLYILRTGGQRSSDEAGREMDRSPGAIRSAMATLVRLGLIECGEIGADIEDPPPEEVPRVYSTEEIKHELQNSSDFSVLVEETQRSLGKMLSPDELVRLFGIYDGLRLPPEVILQLVTHCISESRKKGTTRPPNMRYIEKAAYTWHREEIFSLDKAEEYLKALEERKSARGEIKSALAIRDRELSSSEKRYVDAWIEMGFNGDAVEIAYDRTVLKTGKLSWGYIDSIIKSWHEKNLHTPEDILKKDTRSAQNTKPKAREQSQKFNALDMDELERMESYLKKLQETDG